MTNAERAALKLARAAHSLQSEKKHRENLRRGRTMKAKIERALRAPHYMRPQAEFVATSHLVRAFTREN